MLTKLEITQERELEWLRYFYSTARDTMGPADADIYQMIKEVFVEHGGILPSGYGIEESEEEEVNNE